MSKDSPQQHEADLQALRKLLFAHESTRIDKLEALLGNQELHAQEIAKILAEAVQIRSRKDNKLGQALTPAVEEALKASIARNPQPLSDALFPVMGPAIRKAINSAIAGMLQSLNQTLEHSFSLQGLRWRWDAIRTGKPFAEIVLLNTLRYRVEQIFLIHKETGLLLKHVALDPAHHEDADMVSGMLTAVQDFIRDSFSESTEQNIESLRMGELQVLIEQGPDVVLALVCRGNPPRSLQQNMQQAIETIQHDFHEELQHFDGDTQVFESADMVLSPLLVAEYQTPEKQGSPFKPVIILGVIALIAAGWIGWQYKQQADIEAKWQHFIQQLEDEPGIVVTQVREQEGKHIITGLRDPLSRDPQSIFTQSGLEASALVLHLQPYHSLDHAFVLKRAMQALNPPQSIILSMQGDTLMLSGMAAKAWVNNAIDKAPLIAGISRVDTSGIQAEPTLIERIQAAIKPDQNIRLSLQGDTLTLSGKATQAWLKQAKATLATMPEIKHLQNKLTLVDSPAYVLKQAYRTLQPPKSVRLLITPELKLIATGNANSAWRAQAKAKAAQIAYISGYDDSGVSLSDDELLQRAIQALNPPASVQLSLRDGVLMATGEAEQSWIDHANDKAAGIEGITRFENQVTLLIDEAAILQKAITRLKPPASVRLSFANGVLTATGKATGAWISQAQNQFTLIDGIYRFDTNNLENTTQAWSDIQARIANTTIVFPAGIAKLDAEAQASINTIASQFKQAQSILPQSTLRVRMRYSNTDSFITSLRLKAIKKALVAQGIAAKRIHIKAQKADTSYQKQTAHFALHAGTQP